MASLWHLRDNKHSAFGFEFWWDIWTFSVWANKTQVDRHLRTKVLGTPHMVWCKNLRNSISAILYYGYEKTIDGWDPWNYLFTDWGSSLLSQSNITESRGYFDKHLLKQMMIQQSLKRARRDAPTNPKRNVILRAIFGTLDHFDQIFLDRWQKRQCCRDASHSSVGRCEDHRVAVRRLRWPMDLCGSQQEDYLVPWILAITWYYRPLAWR